MGIKLKDFGYDIEIVTSNIDFAVILMVSEYFLVVYFQFENRVSTLGEKVLYISYVTHGLFSETNHAIQLYCTKLIMLVRTSYCSQDMWTHQKPKKKARYTIAARASQKPSHHFLRTPSLFFWMAFNGWSSSSIE